MSVFGDLKSTEKCKTNTSSSDLTDIPVFKFSEVRNKDEIGRGGFSTVFTAKLPSSGEKIVVKNFLTMTSTRSANCLKKRDYWTLCDIQISLVWKAGAQIATPYFLSMFTSTWSHSAWTRLSTVYKPCFSILTRKTALKLIVKCFTMQLALQTTQHAIASGLQFLHENGISQRDLKPANILVSNQQYCQLSNPAEIEERGFAYSFNL